jgi:hypothetical protein
MVIEDSTGFLSCATLCPARKRKRMEEHIKNLSLITVTPFL